MGFVERLESWVDVIKLFKVVIEVFVTFDSNLEATEHSLLFVEDREIVQEIFELFVKNIDVLVVSFELNHILAEIEDVGNPFLIEKSGEKEIEVICTMFG